ncbi:MAG: MarR family winged helix-turn-helix transcriptional regulator [Candidatus Pristimantibacillus sp.]
MADAGQIRMKDLADKLGVTVRTVTDFIDALEKDDLLNRFPDPTDRRATLIQLTDHAQANIKEALAVQKKVTEKLFENLSPESRNQLLELLFLLFDEKDLSSVDENIFK